MQLNVLLLVLGLCLCTFDLSNAAEPTFTLSKDEVLKNRESVREMFYHGFNNYMIHAFPHDELKPLSRSWSDSLGELGGTKMHKKGYTGVAMTLIDSLSTLAVLNDKDEFVKHVNWIGENVSFDQDVRVNLFELNIRLLGGLLSAHSLASDEMLGLFSKAEKPYDGSLLLLAEDLGTRMLSCFKSDSHIPYAWLNLKTGVDAGETRGTCTAGVGTLLLEFGLLSYYTNNSIYYNKADNALSQLWNLRSKIDLFGNTLNGKTLDWENTNAGIGAGIDSFYEYLLKSSILFGNNRYLSMFDQAYAAAMKYLKHGVWYIEAHMNSGKHSHAQFNSLSAFWPGMQVLYGDVAPAIDTQEAIYNIWSTHGVLPERYLLMHNKVHSTENYYPLRPELIESTYYLYTVTKDPVYLRHGERYIESLTKHTRVEHGFCCVKNVEKEKKVKEDRMTSFFLAETIKYLYLLFDENNHITKSNRYVFTTEGHLFPVLSGVHNIFGSNTKYGKMHDVLPEGVNNMEAYKQSFYTRTCDVIQGLNPTSIFDRAVLEYKNKININIMTEAVHHQCAATEQTIQGQKHVFDISVGHGSFHILVQNSNEGADIRSLGSGEGEVELVHYYNNKISAITFNDEYYTKMTVQLHDMHNDIVIKIPCIGAMFGFPFIDYSKSKMIPREESWKGKIVFAKDTQACSIPDENFNSKVVFIVRGGCTFAEKVLNLQKSGALAVIVGNMNEKSSIFIMGADGTQKHQVIQIPSVMIEKTHAMELLKVIERVDICVIKKITNYMEKRPKHSESIMKDIIYGRKDAFQYYTSTGWSMNVAEKDGTYLLQIT